MDDSLMIPEALKGCLELVSLPYTATATSTLFCLAPVDAFQTLKCQGLVVTQVFTSPEKSKETCPELRNSPICPPSETHVGTSHGGMSALEFTT